MSKRKRPPQYYVPTTSIQQGAQRTVVAHRQELRIAPLPKPEELAHFDQVLPGLAERIVAMAEANGEDRRRTNGAIRLTMILGQVFAFVVVMTGLIGGFYFSSQGHDLAGVAAIITAIGVPLGIFVVNRMRKS